MIIIVSRSHLCTSVETFSLCVLAFGCKLINIFGCTGTAQEVIGPLQSMTSSLFPLNLFVMQSDPLNFLNLL